MASQSKDVNLLGAWRGETPHLLGMEGRENETE